MHLLVVSSSAAIADRDCLGADACQQKVSVLDRFEPNDYTRFIPIIERRQTAVVAKAFSKTPGGPIWAVLGSSEAFGIAYLKAPPTARIIPPGRRRDDDHRRVVVGAVGEVLY